MFGKITGYHPNVKSEGILSTVVGLFVWSVIYKSTSHIFYKVSGNFFVTFAGESICL